MPVRGPRARPRIWDQHLANPEPDTATRRTTLHTGGIRRETSHGRLKSWDLELHYFQPFGYLHEQTR